jgi:hypothetical protein
MARKVPSESGHEHFVGKREVLGWNRTKGTKSPDTRRNREQEGHCSLVKSREALQRGCQTVHLILI